MTTAESEHEAKVRFPYAGYRLAFVELYATLQETLDLEQRGLLRKMIELAEQATVDEEHEAKWALVDGIARHFPAFAPAIRAVAHHVFEFSGPSDCGVDRIDDDPPPWVAECVGPAPTVEGNDAA